MFQLPFATSQAAANLAQRMRPPQLAKQHGHKLAPTGETPRVPLCLVLLDCFLEISARKQFQHLRENAAYFVHRLSLLRSNWFLLEPNPTYQGLSLSPLGTYAVQLSANLDSSVLGGTITPNALNDGNAQFPEFHNVYVEPENFRYCQKHGNFPEGT